jgi:hypothetical protein
LLQAVAAVVLTEPEEVGLAGHIFHQQVFQLAIVFQSRLVLEVQVMLVV